MNCYCALIEPFDSVPRFVILTQPREAKHRFGTGRMAHRCLSNSLLLEGVDFSADERVDRELNSRRQFSRVALSEPAMRSIFRAAPRPSV